MSDLLNGPNQAQAMLRRVSPEGRARAARERQRRQQRSLSLIGRIVLVTAVIGAALAAYQFATGTLPGFILAIAGLAELAAIIGFSLTGARPVSTAHLDAAPIASLPSATAQWLESQCPALPAPAVPLADAIVAELGALGPQVARLRTNERAADAVRRLLSVELPGLVERHASVPATLRSRPQTGGQSADEHLLNGLAIVRDEVARMSEQLASGDVDALATQDRFLELKYQGDAMLGPGSS